MLQISCGFLKVGSSRRKIFAVFLVRYNILQLMDAKIHVLSCTVPRHPKECFLVGFMYNKNTPKNMAPLGVLVCHNVLHISSPELSNGECLAFLFASGSRSRRGTAGHSCFGS